MIQTSRMIWASIRLIGRGYARRNEPPCLRKCGDGLQEKEVAKTEAATIRIARRKWLLGVMVRQLIHFKAILTSRSAEDVRSAQDVRNNPRSGSTDIVLGATATARCDKR